MKMASARNVETSVANNSPSQDLSHPDDLFQSRYITAVALFPGHFYFRTVDVTILYFVIKTKQIRTICSEDLSTSLLSSVLFAAELRFI